MLFSRLVARLVVVLTVCALIGANVGASFASTRSTTQGAGAQLSRTTGANKAPRTAASAPGQLLVRIRPGADPAEVEKLHERAGGRASGSIRRLGVTRVKLRTTGAEIDEALAVYRASDLVEFAEPNYRRKAAEVYPNDPLYPEQWGLFTMQMGQAWESAGSSLTPVKVAVLDTGIDLTHEDLQDALAEDPARPGTVLGRHFYTDASGRQVSDAQVRDEAGHGTHISGIIAGKSNNGLGISGISSAARLMPVKVLDDVGFGDDASIAEGLMWAVDNGARVINMSLAGPTPSNTLADAVTYARSKGAIIVAATGNDGSGTPNYPAAYEGVIGVGAIDSRDAWVHQSNYGPHVDVVAPGMNIVSTYPSSKTYDGQPYEALSGTSMATGFVSGLAAMLLSINPSLTNDKVEGILYVTSDDLGSAGWDRYYGHGRINARRAVAIGSDTARPSISITSPANGTKVTGATVTLSATASDGQGSVSFVEFYVNGMRQGASLAPPYNYNLDTANLYGKNTVRAVAYDASGNSSYAEITCYKQTFSDVDIAHWAFEDIEMLTADGVTSGYPGGVFRPTNSVGRAEFVKMLVEGLGFSKKAYYSGYFTDVPETHWAWPYIEAAYDLGMVTGYGDNRFFPEYQIKRVEMASILMRSGVFTIDYSGTLFNDVPASHWGFIPVMSARNAGIITGYPGNYFRPEHAMSRAEAARIIKNTLY